jgi:riboflavin biosynthesis pyrimidine reductase
MCMEGEMHGKVDLLNAHVTGRLHGRRARPLWLGWQAAEKVAYSRTLAEPRCARTKIEREFDPHAVRRLKANAEHDITVDGPALAAQAIRAGLIDEFQMIVCPVVVGSGNASSRMVCGCTLN